MRDFLYPLRVLHGRLHDYTQERKHLAAIKSRIQSADQNAVLFVMTPEHGNLGDHALAYSESRMLNTMGVPYVEITGKEISRLSRFRQLHILNGHPILFNGGGYLGTLWPRAEEHTREIIRNCPNSVILMLPNTIFYPDTPEGRQAEADSAKIYNAHPSLYLYARERISYEKMRGLYNNVKLMPDMVLSLDCMAENSPRSGCILSLRRDHEKTRTQATEKKIHTVVSALFGSRVTELDMVVDYAVLPTGRESALKEQFQSFASAELVITDRLHGMIFAAITGTPCIVIDSMSPKVRGCYEWIRDLGYIRFADNPDEITELYRTMPETRQYSNKHLQHYYDELKKDIIEKIKMEDRKKSDKS